MDQQKPKRIYKYESFSTQSLENLKNRALYFGSPARFNDPYDCSIMPNFGVPEDDEIEEILIGMMSRESDLQAVSAAARDLSKMSVEQKRVMFLGVAERLIASEVMNFNKGVTCFSEKNDNLLMWSHYGGRYKGFCLEFSTAVEPFEKIRKVAYRNVLPEVNLVQLLNQAVDLVETLFCIKAIDWSYEAEWRAFHMQAETAYYYPEGCLTGVYFGPEMNNASMEIICLILGGQEPGVKFWRGKRSPTEFKVEFEEKQYMSHLEAKRLGLRK
jgi:hypothetical protein